MPSRAMGVVESDGSRPSMLHFAWEFPRVLFEVGRLACTWELLVADNRRSSRCPVMVLPGFLGGDDSTLILRRFLTRLGYTTLPWLQGQNTGQMELLDGAMRRFYRAHQVYGEKIALVGQSLGGIYAREIAREFPDAVRCVVTLGSPFAADDDGAAIPAVQELFESMSGESVGALRDRLGGTDPRTPLGMPTTAIYSKTDGVAAWRACIDADTVSSENVEVLASHTGMAMNPDVLAVVADRLAQDPANWQKFDRQQGLRCWVYPKPATHEA